MQTVQSDDVWQEKRDEVLKALQALLPHVINSDNQLDIKALQEFIELSHTTSNNQGYELTFAGKGLARAQASEATPYELRSETAQSKNFDSSSNTIIRGDNLDALKILQANYHNKVKMIYIDPPYNTQSENFIYKDNFKQSDQQLIQEYQLHEETIDFLHNVYGTRSHSGWLAFMYPRIKLARDLLRDDGVIFISIDDNEQANLKLMCDEIFGESNFVANIVRKTKLTSNKGTHFSPSHEYILIYCKNIFTLPEFNDIEAQEEESYIKLFKYKDNIGAYNLVSLYMPSLDKRPNQRYYITCPDGSKVIGKKDKMFRWTEKTLLENIKQDRVVFIETKTSPLLDENGNQAKWNIYTKIYLHERQNKGSRPVTLFNKYPNSTASKYLINMKIPFEFSKPKELLKYLIKICSTQATDNDIILDFFAGSGTTGDAVMRLNAEDGGNRKYILVQLDEAIDAKRNKEAYDFCMQHKLEPLISSICIERIKRAGEKILQEQREKDGLQLEAQNIDIGYKVFSLTRKPSFFRDEDNMLKLSYTRTKTLDTLYTMLCATCKTLDTPIEEIIKDSLYMCDNELYLLAAVTYKVLEKYRNHKINIDIYADIHLEDYLNLGVQINANICIVH